MPSIQRPSLNSRNEAEYQVITEQTQAAQTVIAEAEASSWALGQTSKLCVKPQLQIETMS